MLSSEFNNVQSNLDSCKLSKNETLLEHKSGRDLEDNGEFARFTCISDTVSP